MFSCFFCFRRVKVIKLKYKYNEKIYKTKYNFWLNVIRKYFYEKNAMLKERMRDERSDETSIMRVIFNSVEACFQSSTHLT